MVVVFLRVALLLLGGSGVLGAVLSPGGSGVPAVSTITRPLVC